MTRPLKNVIVGTAGHIDHGKSSLVEALTGTHPDRLEEEKRRGITIDLGFAFLDQSSVRFGFVDVPGHERFVSNMLAGAAGIDLLLLAIAADSSIQPQTREHFEICRLLGVQRGVVALTKSDLVDAQSLEMTRLEIQEFLRGSFLEHAAIVPVSAKTGEGLEALRRELLRGAEAVEGKDASKILRLPIDRSFSVKGFGTVVTGTLLSGSIAPGDEVELLPAGERLRVRGVQSGGKTEERATAGLRTAVNLASIESTALKRGMVLAAPGRFRPTQRVDVRLELISPAPLIKQRTRVHFHAGTSGTIAEIRLYRREQMAAGERAFAHLRLQEAMLLMPGDRFIVRQFSPVVTIGGGVVLDNLARRPVAKDTTRVEFLETLEHGNAREKLRAMTRRSLFGLKQDEIAARTGAMDREIAEAAKREEEAGQIKIVSRAPLVLLGKEAFEELKAKITARLERFHKENPLSAGMAREELRASAARRALPETFRAVLEQLLEEKKLVTQGELVKLAGSEVTLLPEEERALAQIESTFETAGLAVPSVKEVLALLNVETKRAEKLMQMLLRGKKLQRISPELILHGAALLKLREKLAEYKKAKGERISVPAFKELAGISRKYAIPLLEYLDRERVTRRAGDERVIL